MARRGRWGNQHYLVALGALIWDDAGQLLLGRHTYLPPPGWSLLGGCLEGTESLEAGMARELAEELPGVEVEIGPAVAWATLPDPRRLAVGFTCYWRGGAFRPSAEIAEVGYFTVEEALRLARRDSRALIALAARRRVAARDSVPKVCWPLASARFRRRRLGGKPPNPATARWPRKADQHKMEPSPARGQVAFGVQE